MDSGPSEAGKDTLFTILNEWHEEHLPALEADRLRERMYDCEDDLIPKLYELINAEMRRAVGKS